MVPRDTTGGVTRMIDSNSMSTREHLYFQKKKNINFKPAAPHGLDKAYLHVFAAIWAFFGFVVGIFYPFPLDNVIKPCPVQVQTACARKR